MGHQRKEEFICRPISIPTHSALQSPEPELEWYSYSPPVPGLNISRIDEAILALNNEYVTFAEIIRNWGN